MNILSFYNHEAIGHSNNIIQIIKNNYNWETEERFMEKKTLEQGLENCFSGKLKERNNKGEGK